MFKRGADIGLIGISVASKAIGFVREMTLLGAVGISYGLDVFVLFFGFASLLSALVGICVVTNLTPIMARSTDPDQPLFFTIEGAKMGALLTAITWIICFSYIRFALFDRADSTTYALAFLIPITVFFAIIAEYHVSLFLSRNRQIPVIVGNILISLPVVIGMILFDFSLLGYAAMLVVTFALRSLIFFALLYRPQGARSFLRTALLALRRKPLVLENARQVLAGGSAMLAYSVVSLVAITVAHRLGDGAAALLAYALKIPLLILTSLWFVLGARFFSKVVRDNGAGAMQVVLRLTSLNVLIAVILAVCAGIFQWGLHLYGGGLSGVVLDFVKVISASLPLLPIIVFVPIIEMSQRILATWGNHDRIPRVAAVIVGVAGAGFAAALVLHSMIVTMLALTVALMAGAIVSLRSLTSAAEFKSIG